MDKEKEILILKFVALFAVMVFASAWFFFMAYNRAGSTIISLEEGYDDYQADEQPAASTSLSGGFLENKEKRLKLLFFGDVMIDRHVGEKVAEKGFDYLFAGISSTSPDFFTGFDLVSANLEGAVTASGAHYPPVQAFDFAFEPALVSRFQDYNFNYFAIANNHLSDQGKPGVLETRQHLADAGFLFSGSTDRSVDDWSATSTLIAGKKIGLLSFSMVYGLLDEATALAAVSASASSSDLVIVNIHWGVEYEHLKNRTQAELAHRLIEAGADLIIGHHPHVVQGIERFQGKLIFYSLGNFIFDQYFSADTQESLALDISWIDGEYEVGLIPLRSSGSQPDLMAEADKNAFLKKLALWSKGDEELEAMIEEGELGN